MDLQELFSSCRSGNLDKLKYLVEKKEVNLNIRDRWDSTPLYYACLCGHEEVVEYLLENGAKCEAQTFDGERILYGALTNDIRNKLHNFKVVTSRVVSRDSYEEFLRKLLEQGDYKDFSFKIHGETFKVHRFILAARSSYFNQTFKNKWILKNNIKLKDGMIDPVAFETIVKFLYTGSLSTTVDEVAEYVHLATLFQLPNLKKHLEEANKRITSFASTKPGTKIKVITVENAELQSELKGNLALLAHQAIPSKFDNNIANPSAGLSPLFHLVDVCFALGNDKFFCHKAMFSERSEYFRALLRDHFGECSQAEIANSANHEEVDIIPVNDLTPLVFARVVEFVYSNHVKDLSMEVVYDLLDAGEMYLLPGLKRICANYLTEFINFDNAIDLIHISRTYFLARLELHCIEYLARHLQKFVSCEEFHRLIVADATEVKDRQQTDTISVIDDIRYHINTIFQESPEAYEKHKLIEAVLNKLQLEA